MCDSRQPTDGAGARASTHDLHFRPELCSVCAALGAAPEAATVARVLETHTPWARAIFERSALWMACSCGWNVTRNDAGSWNDHFVKALDATPTSA